MASQLHSPERRMMYAGKVIMLLYTKTWLLHAVQNFQYSFKKPFLLQSKDSQRNIQFILHRWGKSGIASFEKRRISRIPDRLEASGIGDVAIVNQQLMVVSLCSKPLSGIYWSCHFHLLKWIVHLCLPQISDCQKLDIGIWTCFWWSQKATLFWEAIFLYSTITLLSLWKQTATKHARQWAIIS